ncbi:FAD-binding oxidoreductase [Tianweitania sp. BSSL-BM11]|uniref:FAD-binding oxidoreductase n=1 Tax=Tianweitania aestuarii TaxID=2814886 RepID=A0ABS5RXS4_9HYPH|nr:FAD-dependent oxidoreductase [Tianweitania aestuarii]MBS9721851.1 FAD-binding oxidoreductase [Tianweitania aestuarii]
MPISRPNTFWHSRVPLPDCPALQGGLQADVVVVGGGFTGLAAAATLAEGGANVVLLEAEGLAHSASGRNAGFVVPNFSKADPAQVLAKLGPERGKRLLAMVSGAADRVFELAREADLGAEAEQNGWLQPAHSPAMAKTVQARVEAWAALGRPVEWLDAAETARRTGIDIYHGALFDRSGGVINPVAHAAALARRAQKAGARLFEGSAARNITRRSSGWRVETASGHVDAPKVLMCTNAHTLGAAKALGRTVIPLNVYQIATEPLDAAVIARFSPNREPLSDTRANIFTFRLTADHRLISGGMAVVPYFGAEARMARRIVTRLARELRLPAVPRVDHIWRGTAAVTTDFLPHLVDLGPGFLGVTACNGRGVAMTTVTGEMIGKALLEGHSLDDLPIPLGAPSAVPAPFLARWAPSAFLLQGDRADRRAIRKTQEDRAHANRQSAA